jgi:DegV family protein with EDD domain
MVYAVEHPHALPEDPTNEVQMKVAVVTDSAANLPRDVVEKHGIIVVPMILKFGERALLDGVDLPAGDFYKALVEERVPVSTSGPSEGDFRQVFEGALSKADAVVCVTVASFVSATFSTALSAAKDFDDRVKLVDSKSASLGEGLVALGAAEAAEQGSSTDEVVSLAEDLVRRTTFAATINTFEFLRRSGRVNALFAYAGTTLNIKPVFAFRGGKLEQLGRPRTRSRAIDRVVEEVRSAAQEGPLTLGIAHADCTEEAEALRVRLEAEIPHVGDTFVSPFTPLMGAHTGPGVLGVGFHA